MSNSELAVRKSVKNKAIVNPSSSGTVSNVTDDYTEFFKRGKQATKKQNAFKLKQYCLWAKTTPQQLINEYEDAKTTNNLDTWLREQQNKILAFYNSVLEDGKAINYARTLASGILSFHKQNTRQVPDRKSLPL